MYWISNLAKLRDNADFVRAEHELGSEAQLSGTLDIEEGAIRFRRLTDVPDQNGLFKYLLELDLPFVGESERRPTKSGYLLKDGTVGELIALLSIYYEARFFLLSTIVVSEAAGFKFKNEYYSLPRACPQEIDPVVFSAKRHKSPEGLRDFLAKIRRLNPKYHQRVILAFHHYGLALREIGIDEEMVFVRLVSAIEVLAKDMSLAAEDVLHGKAFDQIVRTDALSSDELEALRKTFETRRSTAKFIKFLDMHCGGFFKGGRRKAKTAWIPRSKLREVAHAVYDARSTYLHDGEPMYLSQRLGPWRRWDTDPSLGMSIGDRLFSKKQKLPFAHFFHRLVRHCMLQYVDTRQDDDQFL